MITFEFSSIDLRPTYIGIYNTASGVVFIFSPILAGLFAEQLGYAGLFWITIAALAALLGLWPGLIDRVATWIGISYPPAALLLAAVLVLLVKSLYSDITHTQLERQLRRVNQRIALLDAQGPLIDVDSDKSKH